MQPKHLIIGLLILILGGAIGYYIGYDLGWESAVKNIFKTDEKQAEQVLRNLSLRANDSIESPLTITGEAPGTWFFEASFPILLTDWNGNVITQTHAQAQSDWMTEDYVPFQAVVEFTKPADKDNGAIVFRKDNPSGLPENEEFIEIPVKFK